MALTLKRIKLGLAINALFGYHVSVVIAGLLVHPYQTVQDIVRKDIPATSILFPAFCWAGGLIILKLIEHFLWSNLPYLGLWWFLFVWGTLFLFFWQTLLLYLFIRFSKSLSR